MRGKKFLLILVISMCFIGLFSYRYYMVNKDYPKATVEKYKISEPVCLDGIKYTVIGKGVHDVYGTDDEKIYYVKVLAENTGNTTINLDFGNIKLRFGNNSESISSVYMQEYNDFGVLYDMEAGENLLVTLPYLLVKDEIPDKNLDNIESYRRELTFSIYPKKIYVDL